MSYAPRKRSPRMFGPLLILLSFTLNLGVFAAEPIKVGHVDGLTGADAAYGTAVDRGIQLAIQEINQAGGVKGRKLELISVDDHSQAQEAVTVATKLVTSDKVMALLGESTSTKALAMAPIAQQYKIPMISPWATNVKVTQMGDYIFRACFLDSFQGPAMAKFVLDHLKLKKVAIFRDLTSDASLGLAEHFTKEFVAKGGTIVASETYNSGDVDFRSQLLAAKAKNPEALYLTGYYNEVGLMARQARETGIKVPLLGGDPWDSPALLPLGGPALENSYFSNHYSHENPSKHGKQFVTDYQKAFGELPSAPAALGYDAAQMLAAAMKETKVLTSPAIRDELAKIKDFAGVTGTITIDKDRNAIKPAVIETVKDGKFHYFTTIDLSTPAPQVTKVKK
jgi:branched-chain amino acid transport system substrate-binding protein